MSALQLVKFMKNLRQNVSILVVVFCFLGFSFASATENAQTKNAKAKPTPTPSKTKKAPTPTPKTAKTTPTKTDKSKSSPTSKTTKNSDNSKTDAKAKTDKDKKSEKDKKNTAKTVKTPTKSSTTKTITKPKQQIVKEKPVTKPQTAKTTKIITPPTPKPKPVVNQKVIVSVISARVLSEPNLDSPTVQNLHIGAVLTVIEKNEDWYKVLFAGDQNASSGWVSKTIVTDFAIAQRNEIYQKIVDRTFNKDAMDFATATELFDFLTIATKEISDEKLLADLSFKRLLSLKAALKAVPIDKAQENPYQTFLKTNEKEIVYSEPTARWYVRLEKFWQLHYQYKNLPISEEIAWQAANNPIAGECEGYINCYLYKFRTTFGEYLNFYPNGKYSQEAIENINNSLQPMVADAKERKVYYAASDTSDRAEFNRYLTELRTIIFKVSRPEKAKTIQQINQIAEGYR